MLVRDDEEIQPLEIPTLNISIDDISPEKDILGTMVMRVLLFGSISARNKILSFGIKDLYKKTLVKVEEESKEVLSPLGMIHNILESIIKKFPEMAHKPWHDNTRSIVIMYQERLADENNTKYNYNIIHTAIEEIKNSDFNNTEIDDDYLNMVATHLTNWKSEQIRSDKKTYDTNDKAMMAMMEIKAFKLVDDSYEGDDFDAFVDEEQTADSLTIPSFNSDITNVLDGGYRPGNIYLYGAGTGVGKTIMLMSEAIHFASLGKKVLYISCEMRRREMLSRTYCNILSITRNDIRKQDGKILKETFKDKVPSYLRNIKYIDGSIGSITDATIISELATRQAQGNPYDVLIVDYLSIIELTSSGKNEQGYEKEVGRSVKIKNIAMQFNIPAITAFQAHVGNPADDVRGFLSANKDHIKKSKAIQDCADFCAIITDHPSIKLLDSKNNYGYVVLNVLKLRDGNNSFQQVPIKAEKHFFRFSTANDNIREDFTEITNRWIEEVESRKTRTSKRAK